MYLEADLASGRTLSEVIKRQVARGRYRMTEEALVDLGEQRTITDDWIASKCGWTPFAGKTVRGWPKATIVRGNVVMQEDEVLATPIGAPMRFWSNA